MSAIDFSGLPFPSVIEPLSFETYRAEVEADLVALYPAIAPTLQLESAIVKKLIQAFGTRETRLRGRVNDGLKGVLTPFARGSNLDSVVVRQGLRRLVVTPATATSPAVMESDAALLRRYLLSFERASAGSRDRYLYEAWTAWPQTEDRTEGLWDAKVNGHSVHGRRGDTEIVISGPFGRTATTAEKAVVSAAVTAPNVAPEAVSVTVIDATRVEYSVSLAIETKPGPSTEFVKTAIIARIRAEAEKRTRIGGEIPPGFFRGVAYDDNVLAVTDLNPVAIPPDPYSIPVLVGVEVAATTRQQS